MRINRNKRRVALDLRQAEGRQVRCTRINTLARVFSEPHVPARQMVAEVDHPAVDRLHSIGNPVKASPQGEAPLRLAPSLRQHAEEVLCDVLEHIPSHLGGLRGKSVVGQAGSTTTTRDFNDRTSYHPREGGSSHALEDREVCA